MIKISAKKRGDLFDVKATGHALYNPGNDIVCAGISALVGALDNALTENGAGFIKHRIAPGDTHLIFRGGAADAYYDMFCAGACGIAESYPDYVEFKR